MGVGLGQLGECNIKLINITGLTNEKYLEVEQLIKEKTVLCLAETQKKIDNIRMGREITKLSSMREMEDRKGGGLMILYREEEDFYMEKQETMSRGFMHVRGKIGDIETTIVLVHVSGNGAGAACTGEEWRNAKRDAGCSR